MYQIPKQTPDYRILEDVIDVLIDKNKDEWKTISNVKINQLNSFNNTIFWSKKVSTNHNWKQGDIVRYIDKRTNMEQYRTVSKITYSLQNGLIYNLRLTIIK